MVALPHRFITSGRVLDYGAGPLISRYITASKYVHTIIAAEYLEANRKAIKDWIAQDPDAFNWRPTFEYVVQSLEGMPAEEVDKRETEVRKKIKAVFPCDSKAAVRLQIPSDSLAEYGPPYDVVMTCLTLETVVESEEEYKDHVAFLASLVRPKGYLVMLGALENTYYTIGAYKFKCFPVKKDMVIRSVKEAGFKDIVFDMAPVVPDHTRGDSNAFYFLYAIKA
ncbi:Nicotinamide N-methyltransferase [Exaiptasia diaphana]|nr:Nicotinamide N-methyltransferase [Exaiptasia diaphana]